MGTPGANKRISHAFDATATTGDTGRSAGREESAVRSLPLVCRWSDNEDDGDDDDNDDVWDFDEAGPSTKLSASSTPAPGATPGPTTARVRHNGSGKQRVTVSAESSKPGRHRHPWTALDEERLRSALEDRETAECGAELVGYVLPSFPSFIGLSVASALPRLVDLNLVQCVLPDLSALDRLPRLETLRITDCNVRDVPAREWSARLKNLRCLSTLCLEALELDNAALHSIAAGSRHVTERISIGPLYNRRQFFPSLRTIVQESRCQTLELFGGGTKDSNLIHVVNGMGRSRQKPRHTAADPTGGPGNAVRRMVVENFACSRATFAKLFRRLHHQSSTAEGLRHFSLALARDEESSEGPSHPAVATVDVLSVVALLQSNTHLQSLSLDPPLPVDAKWRTSLLRAAQRNTNMEELNGVVLLDSGDKQHGPVGAAAAAPAPPSLPGQRGEEKQWTDRLAFSLKLNRCGRRALELPGIRATPALWPHVLRHALERTSDPNVLLYFLRAFHHWQ